jgi:hypothetical protein
MQRRKRASALILIVVLSVNINLAQVEKIRVAGAVFNLNTAFSFSENAVDTTGNYSDRSVQFGFSIPVFQNIKIKEKDQELSLTIISLNSRNTIRMPRIDFINYDKTIFSPSFGMSVLTSTSNKNYWLFSVNTSLSEDQVSIKSPTLRLEGSGLFIHRINPEFSYHAGLAYSYVFGREFIFPVIGLRKQFAKQFIFTCSLPVSVALKYYPEDKGTFFSVYMKPLGSSALTANGSQMFGLNEKLWMQNRQILSGAGARIKIHKELFLNIDGGFLSFRKLTFSKSNSNLRNTDKVYQTKIANTEFIQIGFTYKFLPNRYTNYIKNDELDWYREF